MKTNVIYVIYKSKDYNVFFVFLMFETEIILTAVMYFYFKSSEEI